MCLSVCMCVGASSVIRSWSARGRRCWAREPHRCPSTTRGLRCRSCTTTCANTKCVRTCVGLSLQQDSRRAGDLVGQGIQLQEEENRHLLVQLMEEELKQKAAATTASAASVVTPTTTLFFVTDDGRSPTDTPISALRRPSLASSIARPVL